MIRILLIIFALVIFSNGYGQTHSNRCGSVDYANYQLNKNSSLRKTMDSIEVEITNFINLNKNQNAKNIITIPVVVHVLYNAAAENISTAKIVSQIDVLNEDYRRFNDDTSSTPAFFKALGADCQIEFCLAKQDPQGNFTNGITRTQTNKTVFDMTQDDAKFASVGGHDIWNRDKYLNLWVVPSIKDGSTTNILGYSQFPGGNASTDGVVIQYKNFGRVGTLDPYYNLGRTTTHEVAHWLNLYHIWGDDGNGCWGTDYVDDTPNQADENYGCPTYPNASCSNTSDMYSNYMDYSDDVCMNIFTIGQASRMRAALTVSRAALLSSNGCQINAIEDHESSLGLKIYPNPAKDEFTITFLTPKSIKLQILNMFGGKILNQEFDNRKEIKIDCSTFSQGLYFIEIKTSKGQIYKKLQIIK